MIMRSAASLLLALALVSCTKDDLTRPVKTELVLEMASADAKTKKDLLEVTGGRFLIHTLEFDGYRESGENYFFTRDFPDSLVTEFSQSSSERIITFEMPQGVYTRIDITLGMPSGKEEKPVGDSYSHASIKGGVELWGTYEDTHGDKIPYLFVYTAQDEFKFTAEAPDGSQQVVIKQEGSTRAKLQFNPEQWMELINPRMLQSAKLSQLDGVPTIIISKYENEHIYNLLANRIEKSASLHFN